MDDLFSIGVVVAATTLSLLLILQVWRRHKARRRYVRWKESGPSGSRATDPLRKPAELGFLAYMDGLAEQCQGDWFFARITEVSLRNVDGSSRQNVIQLLDIGDEIFLAPNDQDAFQRGGVKVLDAQGRQLGLLEQRVASEISNAVRRGTRWRALVAHVGQIEGRTLHEVQVALLRWYAFPKFSRSQAAPRRAPGTIERWLGGKERTLERGVDAKAQEAAPHLVVDKHRLGDGVKTTHRDPALGQDARKLGMRTAFYLNKLADALGASKRKG